MHSLTPDIVENDDAHAEAPADADEPAERVVAVATPKCTGRVVGIVRRNWRPYCGMLLPCAPQVTAFEATT